MANVIYYRTVKENIETKDCPFCGSKILNFSIEKDFGDTVYRIICATCHTKGPIAIDEEDAFKRWDKRINMSEYNEQKDLS